MNPNILLSQSESELERHFSADFIAHIDGRQTTTLRQFYEAIADLLEIPDFGFTLEALNDALNDLGWLEDERIVLYITNTADFISKERDPAKMSSVLNVLDATAEDWKWVDDDEQADRKEIIIVFEDSPRIRKLLDQESIDYKLMAELD
ncbi:barstar family protein [Spirosoma taeanense]|uniref:Barstar family protein n=1 Tax=Spirosoma taeanense TaxID=2735870 RepID=A0A6M5YFJ7_9BACT|nr:barstar family protein [Spirosoma taeanense]QJW92066.1 barstar family protein [Spirosoma taeanense]